MADAPDGNLLTRKIGPLPVWAYAGIGIGLIVLLKRRQAAQQSAAATSATTGGTGLSPDLSGAGGIPFGAGGGGGGVTGGGSAPGATGTSGVFSTNTDWETAAINALVGHGYDPGLAANAIASYLAGGQLSQQMAAAISDAIRYAGAPPNAMVENIAPPGPGAPPPGPAPAAPSAPAAPAGPAGQQTPAGPADRYNVGQQIPGQGSVVESILSPVYGWLNLLSNGAVYQGGGAQQGASIATLQQGGSFLGHVASLPASQRAAELALHGQFNTGKITLLPGGGYTETNDRGETYTYGH